MFPQVIDLAEQLDLIKASRSGQASAVEETAELEGLSTQATTLARVSPGTAAAAWLKAGASVRLTSHHTRHTLNTNCCGYCTVIIIRKPYAHSSRTAQQAAAALW